MLYFITSETDLLRNKTFLQTNRRLEIIDYLQLRVRKVLRTLCSAASNVKSKISSSNDERNYKLNH